MSPPAGLLLPELTAQVHSDAGLMAKLQAAVVKAQPLITELVPGPGVKSGLQQQ